MGLKQRIRQTVPPTSRAFMSQTEALLERLRALQDQVAEISVVTGSLHGQIATLREENAALRGIVDSMSKRVRYGNLEYAAKTPLDKSPILVAGWYGAENFGDELMLCTLLERFPEDALERVSVLLWDNYRYPEDLIDPRVSVLHYPVSTWDLDWLATRFETLVWGGGAIIDDCQFDNDADNYNTGNLFLRLSRKMLERGKRVFCLGLSSVSRLKNPTYIEGLKKVVEGCNLFSLRDPYSREVLLEVGVPAEGIELCEDLAFANEELAGLPKWTKSHSNGAPKRIAIVPLSTEELVPHYVSVLSVLLEACNDAGEPLFDLSLVPFLNENGHDTWYCQSLVDQIGAGERIRVCEYARTMGGLGLERYDVILSYKYHSALIALVQQVPTLCVVDEGHSHYGNKMRHLVQLFESGDALVTVEEFEEDCLGRLHSLLESPRRVASGDHVLREQSRWLAETCGRIVGE